MAKVINRQGRGYTFDVLRAKLLFRKMPDKEHFNHEKLRIMQVNHVVESTPSEVIVRSRISTSQIRRLLISKYESRCQSCLGVFTPQELWATWLDRKKTSLLRMEQSSANHVEIDLIPHKVREI